MLTRATTVLGSLFIIGAFVLTIVGRTGGGSVVSGVKGAAPPAQAAPALPMPVTPAPTTRDWNRGTRCANDDRSGRDDRNSRIDKDEFDDADGNAGSRDAGSGWRREVARTRPGHADRERETTHPSIAEVAELADAPA